MADKDIEFMTRSELKDEINRLRGKSKEKREETFANKVMIAVIVAELVALVYLTFWS